MLGGENMVKHSKLHIVPIFIFLVLWIMGLNIAWTSMDVIVQFISAIILAMSIFVKKK